MNRPDKNIDLLANAYLEELRSLTLEQLEAEWSECWANDNYEEDEADEE